MYTYKATHLKTIDGDTADFLVDLGFFISLKVRVRLAEINAPEKNTPEGKISKDYLDSILKANPSVVLVVTGPDKYQPRWIAHVLTDNFEVSEHMIENNYAKAYGM